MNIVWGFAPFIVFSLVDHSVGLWQALIAATLTALALVARHRLEGRSVKILEVGSVALFALLALYVSVAGADLSLPAIRAMVDAGLFLIAAVSIGIGTPFTIQYARETTPEAYWNSPRFQRANLVISAVWALGFAVNALADLALVYTPGAPPQIATLIGIATLVASVKFTAWYPRHLREASGGGDPTAASR